MFISLKRGEVEGVERRCGLTSSKSKKCLDNTLPLLYPPSNITTTNSLLLTEKGKENNNASTYFPFIKLQG